MAGEEKLEEFRRLSILDEERKAKVRWGRGHGRGRMTEGRRREENREGQLEWGCCSNTKSGKRRKNNNDDRHTDRRTQRESESEREMETEEN